MGSLRHGFGWNALTQGVSVVITLLMVPIVIGRLGLAAYGVLTLAQSAGSLLQTLDGGMLAAATRYLGISIGAENHRQTADYLATITLIVVTLACAVGAGLFFLAPALSGLFHMSASLRTELIYAGRIVAILLPLGLIAGLLQSVLTVNGQFRILALTNIVLMAGYALGVLVFVSHKNGVETVMKLTLLQQILAVMLTLPWAFRYVNPLRGRLLPRVAVKAMVKYSLQIQLTAVVNVINVQTDALIVGAVLPIRYVGLFGVGANLAAQLRAIPLNLAGPLVARLTQTFGRGGPEAIFREYSRVQNIWAVFVGAFCAVMLGAAVFQLEAWLGPRFVVAGLVSLILQAGNLINLLTMPLDAYLQITGRADLCLRYALLGTGFNLMLTLAFIWVGVYGIAGGTAAGAMIGTVAVLWLARRAVSPDIPSFLKPVPWTAALIGASASAAAGAALLAICPRHGTIYLLVVSVAVIPGACAFALAELGPRRLRAVAAETRSTRSLSPLIDALAPPSV